MPGQRLFTRRGFCGKNAMDAHFFRPPYGVTHAGSVCGCGSRGDQSAHQGGASGFRVPASIGGLVKLAASGIVNCCRNVTRLNGLFSNRPQFARMRVGALLSRAFGQPSRGRRFATPSAHRCALRSPGPPPYRRVSDTVYCLSRGRWPGASLHRRFCRAAHGLVACAHVAEDFSFSPFQIDGGTRRKCRGPPVRGFGPNPRLACCAAPRLRAGQFPPVTRQSTSKSRLVSLRFGRQQRK